MRIFDFIEATDPEVTAAMTKIHLATWNGKEDPFDVYLRGEFDEWQRWQTRRNFERPFILSLISLATPNHWLYAGVHAASGSKWYSQHKCHYYNLSERKSCAEFSGRLIATFTRVGRQSYLRAENWADRLIITEIQRERMTIGEFPGFKGVHLNKAQLDTVAATGSESWRAAL